MQVEKQADRALRNLTSDQRIQLTALLVDVQGEIEIFNDRRRGRNWSSTVKREGPALQKMLPRNLAEVRRSLLLLADRGGRWAAIDRPIGVKYRDAAKLAITVLRELPTLKPRSFNELSSLTSELRHATKNPITFAMVRLYWFFRSECLLRSGEAEVRVALLRNSLWKRLGVEEVDLHVESETDPSKGCRAVCQAVARFRASIITSR
jgi:hypothetical protein